MIGVGSMLASITTMMWSFSSIHTASYCVYMKEDGNTYTTLVIGGTIFTPTITNTHHPLVTD